MTVGILRSFLKEAINNGLGDHEVCFYPNYQGEDEEGEEMNDFNDFTVNRVHIDDEGKVSIEFYPDTDAKYGLRVWILTHREDQSSYETTQFSDLMPGFVNYCDLHYPEDEENPEEYQWGSFYLNPADCQPGYYDFVYVYEGKAIAKMLTYFYADGEIQEKSDEELEKLMKGLSAY